MYWCNCAEGWKTKGRTFSRRAKSDLKMPFLQVQVLKDDICPHCDHYAFFSKKDPNESTK